VKSNKIKYIIDKKYVRFFTGDFHVLVFSVVVVFKLDGMPAVLF